MLVFNVAIRDEDAEGGLDPKDFTNRVVSALDEIKEKFLSGKDGGFLFNKEGHKVGTWGDETINEARCVLGPFEADSYRDTVGSRISLHKDGFQLEIQTSPQGNGAKNISISDGYGFQFSVYVAKDFGNITLNRNGLAIGII